MGLAPLRSYEQRLNFLACQPPSMPRPVAAFTQSARPGLLIYRLAGGAGFVWVASYNQSGRGTLRFSAVDASTYSPQELTPAPPDAAHMPGGAASAVDAEPTSPPGATTQ